MKVDLVSRTQPVVDGIDTAEQLLAHCARVSNPSNQMNNETAPKLLNYCAKNQHWSVFEHAHFTLRIVTSRGIAAQILRHRSFCFQEFSQRYAVATEFETYEARRQDTKNRQNSIDDLDEEVHEFFDLAQEVVNKTAESYYTEALDRGIAKEQARFLLPLSTQTTLYMTGNVRSWLHYCQLRTDPSTQLEHREIAEACQEILFNEFPTLKELS